MFQFWIDSDNEAPTLKTFIDLFRALNREVDKEIDKYLGGCN